MTATPGRKEAGAGVAAAAIDLKRRTSRADRLRHLVPVIVLVAMYAITVGIAPGYLKAPQICLLYTSPSPRDGLLSRMPSSA